MYLNNMYNPTEPNVNRIVDYTLTELGYGEPITIDMAKLYCRVSTGTIEDQLFAIFITAARMAIEKFAGISLVPKTATVFIYNYCGLFKVPFGPVVSPITITDEYGNNVDAIITGDMFPEIKQAMSSPVQLNYMCGYGEIPAELKVAILDQINFMYENRGDTSDAIPLCQKAQLIAQKYYQHSFFE